MQTSTSPQVTAPDSLAALLPSWQRHLRAANLAPRTVQSYAEAAEQFGGFLASRGDAHERRSHPGRAAFEAAAENAMVIRNRSVSRSSDRRCYPTERVLSSRIS